MTARARPTGVHAAALAEVYGPGGLIEPHDLEGLARDAYERAELPIPFPDPQLLIPSLGFQLKHTAVRGCAGAAHCFGVIYFRPLPDDPRRQGLALFHELAHALLESTSPYRTRHDHRDVWRLTLALTMPWSELRALVRREGWSAAALRRHQRHAPTWALELRLRMALELIQVA